MNSSWRIAISIAIGVFVSTSAISLLVVRNRLDTKMFVDSFVQIDKSIEASFVPKNNYLNIVVVPLKNPGLQNTEQFRFSLFTGGRILHQADFSGRNIGDPSDVRFQFVPLADSRGRNLAFRIEPLGKEGEKISVGVDSRGNIVLSSYYRAVNKKDTFFELVRSWRDNVLENVLFFIVWLSLLGSLVVLSKKNR